MVAKTSSFEEINIDTARFHLKIFEDLLLYGTVKDATLVGKSEVEKKHIKLAYFKAYRELDDELG